MSYSRHVRNEVVALKRGTLRWLFQRDVWESVLGWYQRVENRDVWSGVRWYGERIVFFSVVGEKNLPLVVGMRASPL